MQADRKKDTAFIGHPVGLGWLSASEFWERFSYYGVQPIIGLYLTHYLFQPEHMNRVWGFSAFRGFVELFYGRGSLPQLAIAIAGLYAALVYVTPLLGGLLADRLIGRTPTVVIGAILMAAGQFMFASDVTLVPAFLCLLLGVGCFKGNIASQVGDLYGHDDPRRADGFQIYFLGIQLAAIATPLVCGTIAQKIDWHLGFVAAGIGMLIGLTIYLAGRKTFPPEPVRKTAGEPEYPPLTAKDWRVVAMLVVLLPVLALSLVSNQEIFGAYPLWAEKNYQLVFFGQTMPVSWMTSLDAFISAILMAGIIIFWRWWATRWREPTEMTKIVIGTAISACAPLVLAAASAIAASTGKPVSIVWAFAFHIVNDLGFANVLPFGLALYSRAAPKGLGGIMIAVYYLHLAIGTALVGKLGTYLYSMPGTTFWAMHAAIMGVGLVLLIAARFAFGKTLAPSYAEPKEEAAA
jgi:proton-dependent oligopeptide transporter, POT family